MRHPLSVTLLISASSILAQNIPEIREYLPADYPPNRTELFGETTPGYFVVATLNFAGGGHDFIQILDHLGTPIFYRRVTAMDFKRQRDSVYTYRNLEDGTFVTLDDRFRVIDVLDYPDADGHEFLIRENGGRVFFVLDRDTVDMSELVEGGKDSAIVLDYRLVEVDRDGDVVFDWKGLDHYEVTDASRENNLAANVIDYMHPNSVDIDYDGAYLISCRNLDEITKIDPVTGEIIWRFGGSRNDFTFTNDTTGFSRQHMFRRRADGTYSLFDNGVYFDPEISRGLIYDIDEAKMKATLIEEYLPPNNLFARVMGSFHMLNDHPVVGFSSGDSPTIVEYSPNGDVAFVMEFIQGNPHNNNFYRAFKSDIHVYNFEADRNTLYYKQDGDVQIVPLQNNHVNDTLVVDAAASQYGSYELVEPTFLPPGETVEARVRLTRNDSTQVVERVYLVAYDDTVGFAKGFIAVLDQPFLDAEDEESAENDFRLSPAFPNPFNPAATIRYALPEAATVRLTVYNALGETVRVLDSSAKQAGRHEATFNASDLGSGVYFYRIDALGASGERFQKTRKMTLIK
jgi:hypothetical protein